MQAHCCAGVEMRAWYIYAVHAPDYDVVCLSTVAIIMTSHNDKRAGLSSCVAHVPGLSLVQGEHFLNKLSLPFQQFVQGTWVHGLKELAVS